MGILPLQFLDGDGPDSLGLHGGETFTIKDLETIIELRGSWCAVGYDPAA
jgi:aconitase A